MSNKILTNQKIWRPLLSTFLLVNIMAIAGDAVTQEWSGYINKYLNLTTTSIITDENDTTDTNYFKSDFNTYTDVRDHAREVSGKIQDEGTVLMTNKVDESGKAALPLSTGSKVTFFSYSTIDIAYGGTGSGGVSVSQDREVDLKKACEKDGRLSMNPTMTKFYDDYFASDTTMASDGQLIRKSGGGWGPDAKPISYQVPEIDSSKFTAEVKNSFAEYDDAAIFVLTRIGGEGNDLTTQSATKDPAVYDNKYLALTDEERSVLQAMKDGPFKKRIVLVNTFNTPELGFLEEYNIDACLYIGGPGECGLDSVIDVLVGNVNPSGRLADTYAYDTFSSPAMMNFGDFTYSNADEISNPDSTKYVMYKEGIYVGYRYYETRYEDAVLDRGNATSDAGVWHGTGDWRYQDEVQFAFGHGLSYTTFEEDITDFRFDPENKKAKMEVVVENTGDVDGKDVVEVYAQAPYTQGGIEKSAIQLVGFAKTDVLKAGEKSDPIEIEIDLTDIASYDSEKTGSYVFENGDYYFALGKDAHDALNNVLAAKGKSTSDGMTANGDVTKVHKESVTDETKKGDFTLSATGAKIENQFENADIRSYDESIEYLSRSDWKNTWPTTETSYEASDEMVEEIASYYSPTNEASAYVPGDEDTSSFKTSSTETSLTIASLRDKSYDDPMWEDLLDQISLQEMIDFNKQGRTEILSIALPATTAVDGPAAWTKSYYKVKWDDYSATAEKTQESMVLYPTETVIAATWNVPLAKELGLSFGEEGLWGGGVGWYGPAANTHRTPYAGRNFEYFSEDGYLASKLAESEIHGAMEKGVIPYFKHFFLNDQETNRIGVCTFANEQTIREIYLRAFQDAFETTGEDDPSCTGVMGGFNRLGLVWTGHDSNLWKNVMEKEWGFTGNVTTDFGQKPQSLMDPLLAYEAGTTMFCTSGNTFSDVLSAHIQNDSKLFGNVREATHRILYNFSHSLAINGISPNSRVVRVRTWYENTLLALIIVSAIGMVLSVGMLVYSEVDKRIGKKEEN